jgi:hypothetical protein
MGFNVLAGGLHGEEKGGRWEELERIDAALQTRLLLRRQAVVDLIEGRKDLLETAAIFRILNEMIEQCPCRYREVYPGRTDEERLCRHVIAWVEGELELRAPHQAKERTRLLTEELEDRLRWGTIELSSPEPAKR